MYPSKDLKKEIVYGHKSKVAIIGLGNIGTILATNLVKSNRSVIIADRTLAKATNLAEKSGSLAQPRAVWFDTIKELFGTYATELQNKLLLILPIRSQKYFGRRIFHENGTIYPGDKR